MEKFEYEGIWWQPENIENRLYGTLKYSPESGAYLELKGSFIAIAESDKNNKAIKAIEKDFLLQPTIILGKTIDGKSITLYRCIQIKLTQHFPGLAVSLFYVYFVFIGCHFNKEEDIIFKCISIEYSNLDDWSHVSGFKEKRETDRNGCTKRYELIYESPPSIEARIDKYRISINFDLDYHSKIFREYHLEQKIFIKITSDISTHFNNYISEITSHIQNFLSLAIGRAIYPNKIIGNSDAIITRLNENKIVFKPIYIFYNLGQFAKLPVRINVLEVLFFYEDIIDNFELYLNNWVKKAGYLQPVYDLYFGTLYNPLMSLNHQFLNLAQALESYHRRMYDGKYVSDDDYKRQYQCFLNAIHKEIKSDFKDSLKIKLKYLNEFSLKKRIKEILRKFGSLTKLVLGGDKSLISDITNTRNFLIHYDKDIETKAKKGQELYWLVQKMRFLLEICLMFELGMSGKLIKKLITSTRRYHSLYLQKETKTQ